MPDLLFEKRAGIAYLTFNRPERRNAISPQMMLQLADAWLEFRDDPALRVAIYLASRAGAYLTGAIIPVDGGITVKPS